MTAHGKVTAFQQNIEKLRSKQDEITNALALPDLWHPLWWTSWYERNSAEGTLPMTPPKVFPTFAEHMHATGRTRTNPSRQTSWKRWNTYSCCKQIAMAETQTDPKKQTCQFYAAKSKAPQTSPVLWVRYKVFQQIHVKDSFDSLGKHLRKVPWKVHRCAVTFSRSWSN